MPVSIVLLAIALLVLALYLSFILPTQWLKVERVHVDLGINRKILQISDIHIEHLRVTPDRIKRLIREERPDLIFWTGDFVESKHAIVKLHAYLEALYGDIADIPSFAVLGNHDYALKNTQPIIDELTRHGIRVLRNESVDLRDFVLIGMDDYCTRHHDAERSFAGVSANKRRVLLQHDPNYILKNDQAFDYMISGHLHGKQFNIPFFFHLKDMGPLPRMGVYKGLHQLAPKGKDKGNGVRAEALGDARGDERSGGANAGSRGAYYISKGISQSEYNARFWVRSEVTVHQL